MVNLSSSLTPDVISLGIFTFGSLLNKWDVLDPTQMKTSTDQNHMDPLHVRATQQQESNMEVEMVFCTTQSAMEGDRRRRLGEIV